MLELPEVITISSQLKHAVLGKEVKMVMPPNKAHKFCWYQGDPNEYEGQIKNSRIISVNGFGIYVEITFDNGKRLCFNDGVNVRLLSASPPPKTYQLLIVFHDDTALAFTVAMYGAIILHDGSYDNEYYSKSLHAVSPFSKEFKSYYFKTLSEIKKTLSLKAFLATEQRFPGIGNGVLQDILFKAQLHPKRKLHTLSDIQIKHLAECVVSVLTEMTQNGGRDTEKDIYGHPCGYQTKMSKNSLAAGCSVCGGQIIKESYLGGSVYYCPQCQPLS